MILLLQHSFPLVLFDSFYGASVPGRQTFSFGHILPVDLSDLPASSQAGSGLNFTFPTSSLSQEALILLSGAIPLSPLSLKEELRLCGETTVPPLPQITSAGVAGTEQAAHLTEAQVLADIFRQVSHVSLGGEHHDETLQGLQVAGVQWFSLFSHLVPLPWCPSRWGEGGWGSCGQSWFYPR